MGIMSHVREAIKMDYKADTGYYHCHHYGKSVEVEAPPPIKKFTKTPGKKGNGNNTAAKSNLIEANPTQNC
jgi:hypothetical protein